LKFNKLTLPKLKFNMVTLAQVKFNIVTLTEEPTFSGSAKA